MFCRVTHGTYLYLCATGGNANHNAQRGREPTVPEMDHFDQSANHLFGGVKVSYDTVLEWTDGTYILMCFTVHLAGCLADG